MMNSLSKFTKTIKLEKYFQFGNYIFPKRRCKLLSLWQVSIIIVAFLYSGSGLFAQSEQIVVVPYNPVDPTVPFPAISGYPITLKAIVRNATSSLYTISWDYDGDGTWDYSHNATWSSSTASIRDIGSTWYPPSDSSNKLYTSIVKVKNNTTGNEVYGATYTLVYSWVPSPNPQLWTDEQVEILQNIAIHENLWYLHKEIISTGHSTSTITGYLNNDLWATMNLLELFALNGRFPAYPNNTINFYGITPPSGWITSNQYRWNNDPYSEDALRIMNYLLYYASIQTIPSGSEDNTCGYDLQGNELYCNRISGTANNSGLYFNSSSFTHGDGGRADCYSQILSGLSQSLFAHSGVPVQVGATGVVGKTLEYVIQELVDYLVYFQIDGGNGQGGYYYNPVNGNYNNSLAESTAGVARGLYDAERFASPYGVIVNNKVKYRLAQNVVNQQGANGLVRRYLAGGNTNNNFNFTGGYLGICKWLGIDVFNLGDNSIPFFGYCTFTRSQLKQAYNNYVAACTPLWSSGSKIDDSNWLDHFWQNGDYLSGDITTPNIYNKFLGSTFNMFYWSMGFNMNDTPPETFAGHNWKREITIHLIRGQSRNDNINNFPDGYFRDDYCSPYISHTCYWQKYYWPSVLAGRTLSKLANYRPTAYWTGAINNDWSNPGNWSHDALPNSNINASIGSSVSYPVIANGVDAYINDLSINPASSQTSLTINSGGNLTVKGTLTNLNGTGGLILKSNSAGTGSILCSNGVDATVERYLTHSKWHFIGMPVETGLAGVFHLPSGHSDIYLKTHLESTNSWGPFIVPVSTPLTKGRGYECWVGDPNGFSQDETIVFKGKLNAGDYATGQAGFYNLEYTATGYNFICNPYPCALDGSINTWSRNNVDASIWVWDGGLNTPNTGGNYRFWNGTMGTLTNGTIPSMQGFFVHANGLGASLTIPQNSGFHSNQSYYKESSIPPNTLRIDAEGNGYADALFISFNELSTEGFDFDLDVAKIFGLNEAPQIYSLIPENKLSINILPSISDNKNKVIDVGFECMAQGQFILKASGFESFATDTEIFIEDLQLGIYQNLKELPIYSFTHQPGTLTNRFRIHFGNPNFISEAFPVSIKIYSDKNDIYILNPNMKKGSVMIYDLLGQIIAQKQGINQTINRIRIKLETGVYIVKFITEKSYVTQKVFVQ